MGEPEGLGPRLSCSCVACLTWRRVGRQLNRGHGAIIFHHSAVEQLRQVGSLLQDLLEGPCSSWVALAEDHPDFPSSTLCTVPKIPKELLKARGSREEEGDIPEEEKRSQSEPKDKKGKAKEKKRKDRSRSRRRGKDSKEEKHWAKEDPGKKPAAVSHEAREKKDSKEEEERPGEAQAEEAKVKREASPGEKQEKLEDKKRKPSKKEPEAPSIAPSGTSSSSRPKPAQTPSSTPRSSEPARPPGDWNITLTPRPPNHPPPSWHRPRAPWRDYNPGSKSKGIERERRREDIAIHGPNKERKEERERQRAACTGDQLRRPKEHRGHRGGDQRRQWYR